MEKTAKLPIFETSKPYSIPLEFYREGFAIFQKRYLIKRNSIMMAVFGLLLISFFVAAVKNPSNTMCYILMMVCAAMIFLLWYNPRKMRRSIMEAVKGLEQERYEAHHDGRVLRIQILQNKDEEEIIPESRISTETADIQELEQFYLICNGKQMFYILPKAAIPENILIEAE